ncbi:MAG: class I SAM-dependent methyltransferase [Phycisphaeraceae bacterium]|nr:MAG: class I SAM-dependent methyltransferase [Phycisphaeraceae bacterium]
MPDDSRHAREAAPTERFSDRAADYARHRPTYPDAIFDAMFNGLSALQRITAADIGAGTGISARLLALRCELVHALEPNDAMRAAGEAAGSPAGAGRIIWSPAAAERAGLPENSIDLVLCAQSFHWFDAAAALREFARILRGGGRLALLWNERDETDEFTEAYRLALLDVGAEHPMDRRRFDPSVIERSGLFTPPRLVEAPNAQPLDEAGLIGRARSASYVPKDGESWERLERSLRKLHARFADASGMVQLRYVSRLHLADRLSRA